MTLTGRNVTGDRFSAFKPTNIRTQEGLITLIWISTCRPTKSVFVHSYMLIKIVDFGIVCMLLSFSLVSIFFLFLLVSAMVFVFILLLLRFAYHMYICALHNSFLCVFCDVRTKLNLCVNRVLAILFLFSFTRWAPDWNTEKEREKKETATQTMYTQTQ